MMEEAIRIIQGQIDRRVRSQSKNPDNTTKEQVYQLKIALSLVMVT